MFNSSLKMAEQNLNKRKHAPKASLAPKIRYTKLFTITISGPWDLKIKFFFLSEQSTIFHFEVDHPV